MTVGTGSLTFEAVPGWPNVPDEAGLIEAIGVAVNSRDLVYVFARGDIPVLVFETDGTFVRGWGAGQFVRPHGISIGENDTLYLVDDMGHSVRQFSGEGELLRTIGPSGVPSDTGAKDFDYRTIRPEAGPPFNLPTNLIVGPGGDLFVTDGYGNARVHRFAPDGELISSWGSPGHQPGQFNVPHGIGSDGERLYIADRENSRVQIFSPDGSLLAVWTDVARPAQVHVTPDGLVYVFELGFHTGVFPWNSPDASKPSGRMSIFDRNGNLLTRWGGNGFPTTPEEFYAPHDIFLDSAGSIYTAEVKGAAASFVGDDTSALPSLRKFVRSGASAG
ncbi:MAG: peptidyl-alpha-hydroxyglycine alpha-amidating lyase family protein [Planctomycetota bacterium]|nr:peptidyl-alpha-hydroxyglycine alpha-amidating lyase family protein [Planctomycetota bacterium]